MAPRLTDSQHQTEPLDVRLRLDPNLIGEARWYLGEIDRTVFAAASGHDAGAHTARVTAAVAALFSRG